MFFRRGAVFVLLGASLGALGANVQNPHLRLPRDAVVHKAAAENIFLESYSAYL